MGDPPLNFDLLPSAVFSSILHFIKAFIVSGQKKKNGLPHSCAEKAPIGLPCSEEASTLPKGSK